MKIKSLIFALFALPAVFACKEAEPVVKPVLEVSTGKMIFNSFGGERPLSVTANNAWTIEDDADWISFSVSSGEASAEPQQVMVYVDENTAVNTDPRVGKITVRSGELTKEIEVSQSASEFVAELSVSASSLSAAAAGGTLTFGVTSNVSWTVASESSWLSFSPDEGAASVDASTVTVTVAANDTYQKRTATVTVSGDDVEETVTIVQAAKELVAEAMEGSGTESDPYLVKTAGNMLAMRDAASLTAATYFRMENDIDMSIVRNWVPVNFEGPYSRQIHFDGGNFTISNFAPQTWNYTVMPEAGAESAETSAEPAVETAGYHSLFGVLYGSVKNLKVDKVTITGTNACGVIGGYVGTAGKPGLVENVTVTNSSVTNSGDRTGGVCGDAREATFRNVSFQGTVTSTYTAAEARSGGFAGFTETSAVFEDCSADVTVVGSSNDLGGFVGKATGEVRFTGCKVKAAVTSTASGKCRVGGFLGWNSTSKAVFTDCHVLSGSSLTDKSGRTAVTNGNYGGFIGFGDTAGSVLEISGCSAHADVDGGVSHYNSCFISYLGYASTTTITDSYASGSVTCKSGNQIGGFLGRLESPASLTMRNCHFDGDVNSEGSYTGGLIGGVAGVLKLYTSHSSGTVTSLGQYTGGLIGASQNDNVEISDCYSTSSVRAWGQQAGGLVGTTTNRITISNCYASGDVHSATSGAAGLVGRVAASSSVTNCIAWNRNVSTSRTATNLYSPGAVLGCAQAAGTYSGCIRRYDMVLVDEWVSLYDQPDYVNAMPPLPSYSTATHQQAYHGKAAAPGATLASVAQGLGWDSTIWNFASEGSSLGFTIKQLGDNKIEF